MKEDLDLIAGDFLNRFIPKDKFFLFGYFSTESEKLFLSYYLIFANIENIYNVRVFYRNFVDHTGFYCSEQWFHHLLIRVKEIMASLKEAEKSFDLDEIERIKAGKLKIDKIR